MFLHAVDSQPFTYLNENVTNYINNSSFQVLSEDQVNQSQTSFALTIITTIGLLLGSALLNSCCRRIREKTQLTQELCQLAAQQNPDLDRARDLIARGAGVNFPLGVEGTALHAAAKTGSPVMIELLVNLGAKIENTVFGFTPFQVAAREGNIPAMRKLIELGANWNSKEPSAIGIAVHASGEGNWDLNKSQQVLNVFKDNGLSLDAAKDCIFGLGHDASISMIEAFSTTYGEDLFPHMLEKTIVPALKQRNFNNLRKILEVCPTEMIKDKKESILLDFAFVVLKSNYSKSEIEEAVTILEENGIDFIKDWDKEKLKQGLFTGCIVENHLPLAECLVERGAPITMNEIQFAGYNNNPEILDFLIANYTGDIHGADKELFDLALESATVRCLQRKLDMASPLKWRNGRKELETARSVLAKLLSLKEQRAISDHDIDNFLVDQDKNNVNYIYALNSLVNALITTVFNQAAAYGINKYFRFNLDSAYFSHEVIKATALTSLSYRILADISKKVNRGAVLYNMISALFVADNIYEAVNKCYFKNQCENEEGKRLILGAVAAVTTAAYCWVHHLLTTPKRT